MKKAYKLSRFCYVNKNVTCKTAIVDCTNVVNCLFNGLLDFPLNFNKNIDLSTDIRAQFGLLLNDDTHHYSDPIRVDWLTNLKNYNILN